MAGRSSPGRSITTACGIASALLGALTLLGWFSRSPILLQFISSPTPMYLETAFVFVLYGMAMVQLASTRVVIASLLAAPGLLIGLLRIGEYVAGAEMAGHQINWETLEPFQSGKMALNSALCVVFTGLAMLLAPRVMRAAGSLFYIVVLCSISLAIAILGLGGYLGDIPEAYRWAGYTPMSLPTVLGFIIQGIGLQVYCWNVMEWRITTANLDLQRANEDLRQHRDHLDDLVRLRTRELGRQRAQLRAFLDHTPACVYEKDLDGRYQLVNRYYEQTFGVRETDLVGRTAAGVHPPEQALAYGRSDAYVRDTGEVLRTDDIVPLVDGLHHLLTIRFPIIEEDGSMTALGAISIDVTEQKRLEEERTLYIRRIEELNAQLERTNRDLDEFAYIASHDLRAPLQAIDNLAAWIAEDAGDTLQGKSLEHLQRLRQRAQRMKNLLDDLLQYSRAGRAAVAPEMVDMQELLQEIRDAYPTPVRILLEPPYPTIFAPRSQLFQVFANLIGNAVKHRETPEGHVWVSHADAGEMDEFIVADDGPGIPPQYHERIFQMFQTLKPRDKVEGSGMGLAIARKIIQNLDGNIRIENRAGGGAQFVVSLPTTLRRESNAP